METEDVWKLVEGVNQVSSVYTRVEEHMALITRQHLLKEEWKLQQNLRDDGFAKPTSFAGSNSAASRSTPTRRNRAAIERRMGSKPRSPQ